MAATTAAPATMGAGAGPATCRRVAFADRSQIIPNSARSPAVSPLDASSSSSYFSAKLVRPRLFGGLGSSSSSGSSSAPSYSPSSSAASASASASRTLDATLSPRAEAASAFKRAAQAQTQGQGQKHARSSSTSSVPSYASLSPNSGGGGGRSASSSPARRAAPGGGGGQRAVSHTQPGETPRPNAARRTSLTLGLPWRKSRKSSGGGGANAESPVLETRAQVREEKPALSQSEAAWPESSREQQQLQSPSTCELTSPALSSASAAAHERRLASASSSSESSALGIFLSPSVTASTSASSMHDAGPSAPGPHDSVTCPAASAPEAALDASSDPTSAIAEEEADFFELLAASSPPAGAAEEYPSPAPPSSPGLLLPAAMLRSGSGAVRPTAVRKPLAFGTDEEPASPPRALPTAQTAPVLARPLPTRAPSPPPLAKPQPLPALAQSPPPPRLAESPVPLAESLPPQPSPQPEPQAVEKTLRYPPMRPGDGEEVVSGACICSDCDALLLLGLNDDYHAQWSRGARRKYLADRAQRRMLARQSLSAAEQLAGVDVPHSSGASIASASVDSPLTRIEGLPPRDAPPATVKKEADAEDGAALVARMEACKMERELESGDAEAQQQQQQPAIAGLLDAARLKTDEAASGAPSSRRSSSTASSPASQAALLAELSHQRAASHQRTSSHSSDDSGTELDDELLAEIQAEAAARPLPASLPGSAANSPAFGLARLPSPPVGGGAPRMGARAMLRQLEAAEREEEQAKACRRKDEEDVRVMGAAVAEGLCRPWTPPVRIGSPEAAAKQRSASPLSLSLAGRSTSPPPRVPSPGSSVLSGLRAPSPLHTARQPSPLGLSVPEGVSGPSRTPSPRLVLPSSPPLRSASPHQAFHARIAAPDVPHLLAISERDAPGEEGEEQVLPPLSAITRRPSPRPMLHSVAIQQRLQAAAPLSPSAVRPASSPAQATAPSPISAATRAAADRLPPQPAPAGAVRPASSPAPSTASSTISAATRAAADRLPPQPAQASPQAQQLQQRPSLSSRRSSSSSVSTRRRSSLGSSSAHGTAATNTTGMSSSSSTGGGGGFFAALAPAASGACAVPLPPTRTASSSSPASSPEESYKPQQHPQQLQPRRSNTFTSATDKRKSSDGLRGLVARLRQ